MSLLITCDTGGWKTPARVKTRLADFAASRPGASMNDELPRHRICDRDAYLAAQAIGRMTGGDVICNEFRSDLVDVGRSTHHRELHAATLRGLPAEIRGVILDEIYRPYRRQVRRHLRQALLRSSYVVHLSIRTFEPKAPDGHWRRGDVGLLYDPARPDEADWCIDLADELWDAVPELKVRRNYPFRGTNDSLTKTMRRQFADQAYVGVELVLNRSWMARSVTLRDQALAGLGEAIAAVTPVAEKAAA